jgi:hypothetical protein
VGRKKLKMTPVAWRTGIRAPAMISLDWKDTRPDVRLLKDRKNQAPANTRANEYSVWT